MFKSLPTILIVASALTLVPISSRAGESSGASLRFVVTMMSSAQAGSSTAELSVVFYGAKPDATIAEKVLRKCLGAARVLENGSDIVASAWYSSSINSADRQSIALENGAKALVYRTADRSIGVLATPNDKDVESEAPSAGEHDLGDHEKIINDARVTKACNMLQPQRLEKLADVAIQSRGERRSQIVRGLRTWCKGNGVNLDRTMSLCVVAISKAAFQQPAKPTTTVADPVEAARRGAKAYKTANCTKCHRDNGRGGDRAPNLTDDEWVQCDGTVEGIRKILIAGIPSSKFKNPDFPFDMDPATRFLKTDTEITDLAVYVKSLSKK